MKSLDRESFDLREGSSPFFDKSEDWEAWRAKLPHREQNLKIQFVTFRLADSLPQSVLIDYKLRKEDFLRLYPKPWNRGIEMLYDSQFTSYMDGYLDSGLGRCVLADSSVRKTLIEAFDFFHNERYHMLAYVIMPNHVHMLIMPYEDYSLKSIMSSIKKFTARAINKITGNKGSLWEEDYFDVLIRSYNHYAGRLEYIRNNPRFLPAGTYAFGGIEFAMV